MQTSEKHQLSTPKGVSHVSPLPPQSIVFRPLDQTESDSSFSHYIGRQFQPYSAVLQDRASLQPKTMITEPVPRPSTEIRPPEQYAQVPEHTSQASNFQPNDEERQQEYPWWVMSGSDEDGFFSIGGILFLFGFICPFLWWIGACWPRYPRERAGKMAERWQQLNLIMSLGFSVLLIIALIVLAVIYTQVT